MPTPASSPMVAAWELAVRLRQRREQVGIEVKTITQTMGFSRNYWSAVENERKLLSEESLVKLLDLFEFGDEERREMIALRAAAKEHGWWSRYSAVLDQEVQRLFGLESGARSIRSYENLLIPGLLQTKDYARAMMTPAVIIPQIEVEELVEARMRRQERLFAENPLRLTALVSEASLRQEIGGRDVLHRQLERIAQVVEQYPDTIDVRVIPFAVQSCGLFGASTVYLIDFENTRLPTVVWQETVTSWGIIDDPIKVRDISVTYREAYHVALGGRDSLKLINQRIEELA